MIRWPLALAALFLLSLNLPALAADASGDAANTVLHLSEQAQRPVARDELRAVLRVDASDSDAARLQAEINRRMAAAVARAKGVAGVTIFTGSYAVYEQQPKDRPVEWHGSAGLTLTSHDAPALLALVADLQQSGLAISALAYELTPDAARGVEDVLAAEALGRLRQRAERVAADLGLAVLRLRDLRVNNAAIAPPQPRFFLNQAVAASSASPPPVAEPGEATVTVTVNADIELAPKR